MVGKKKAVQSWRFIFIGVTVFAASFLWLWASANLFDTIDKNVVYAQVDDDVRRFSQQLAFKSLYLARTHMLTKYKDNEFSKAELWKKLKHRVEKIYDFNRSWKDDRESPFEILRIISREHALGLFLCDNNSKKLSVYNNGDIYEQAHKNLEWLWVSYTEEKIYDLQCLGWKAREAESQNELRSIQKRIDVLEDEIRYILFAGPPSSQEK